MTLSSEMSTHTANIYAIGDRAVSGLAASGAAAGSPDVIERPDTRTTEGDHDRFSHYVNKTALTRSAVSGEAVVALCGKKWVPTRDGERYPVCPACKEIYAALRS
ncbi:DUF3039 domain-containing protein [Candidatus Poriferisodalis sp.]|uniref:DUF3039 domain-containing protein n=1 Tax=Candidatus Poriferisodalis sp. TaxID=3101277 RepID=UPI003B01C3BC